MQGSGLSRRATVRHSARHGARSEGSERRIDAMTPTARARALVCLSLALAAMLFAASRHPPAAQAQQQQPATSSGLPSETPASFEPVNDSFDYVKRVVMIPMRDGVKLHTVVIVPKGASRAPILLTRTPYDADEPDQPRQQQPSRPDPAGLRQRHRRHRRRRLHPRRPGRARQARLRGRLRDEPAAARRRRTRPPVDHATDTYDTIDWLVKNVPETNGRVGILGISYDGFLPLMALVNPHPALKVSVPMNPMVDGWMGDDWFHNGAFRQQMMRLHLRPGGGAQVRRELVARATTTSTTCSCRRARPASSGAAAGSSRSASGASCSSIRATTRSGAIRRWTSCWRPSRSTVPVMLVHSLWDQEDIYGAVAVYRAIEPKDTANDKVFLVMGPWHHGQEIGDGSSLGALKFGSRHRAARSAATSCARSSISISRTARPRRTWRRSRPSRPAPTPGAGCRRGRPAAPAAARCSRRRALPHRGAEARCSPPRRRETRRSTSTSPIPRSRCRTAPGRSSRAGGGTWAQWLVDDQREASGRPDVAVFVSDALKAAVKISGQPNVNLIASTSGTDADWVVKVIDVYPDEVAAQPQMGGYQLMVSADIFRGRYREGVETAKAIAADRPLLYRFALPDGESRVPARPPDDGADPIELVPALRSQPADLRAEHLPRDARPTTRKRRSGSITPPGRRASSSCRSWLRNDWAAQLQAVPRSKAAASAAAG